MDFEVEIDPEALSLIRKAYPGESPEKAIQSLLRAQIKQQIKKRKQTSCKHLDEIPVRS